MITKIKLKQLAEVTANPCISIYIPTYRAGNNLEDQLRFKNALSDARGRLLEYGYEEKAADRFLSKGYQLLDDNDFWLHLSDGFAVFINPNHYEQFILPNDVNPLVEISDRFYLRPLLPALTGRQRFFLLALSQNEIRFFEGNKYSITPVIIEDLVPANMETALALDEPGANLQYHSGRASSESPIFHGAGLGKDDKVKQLKQFFQQVDDGLMEMLHDERVPMVLAGVDYLIPIYKEISKYLNITNIHIGGNPEHENPEVLHEKAWVIIDEFNQNQLAHYKSLFPEQLSKSKASTELSSIIRAADAGKIDVLFVNKDQQVRGNYEPQTQRVQLNIPENTNDQDLLEWAAMVTYQKGGTVYNVDEEEMPDKNRVANALFRY